MNKVVKFSAVIFDLNGVLIQSEFLSRRIERDYGVSDSIVVAALKKIMPKLREPNAPSAWSLFEPYIKEWRLPFSEDEFFTYYFSGESLNKELFEFVKELTQRGIKVFLLSNNFKERTTHYRNALPELLKVIDKAYFSWESGFVKPDNKAWQQIIDEFKLDPKTCLYIDDSNTNITSAQNLGLIAMKFSSIEHLRETIKLD